MDELTQSAIRRNEILNVGTLHSTEAKQPGLNQASLSFYFDAKTIPSVEYTDPEMA